jgi:hypothetical protein
MIQLGKFKVDFLNLVIAILVIILLLKQCNVKPTEVTPPTVKRDTVWIYKDSTVYSKPSVVKTEPYAVPIDRWNTEYLPDTNYSKLVKQYEEIVRELLAKNISKDSLKIDSIGYVHVTDTVSKNLITGRAYHYSFKYPVITNTITIPEKKRNQLYVGGGLQGSSINAIDQINAGAQLINKKDQSYGITVGINSRGNIMYGINSYFKIKLK